MCVINSINIFKMKIRNCLCFVKHSFAEAQQRTHSVYLSSYKTFIMKQCFWWRQNSSISTKLQMYISIKCMLMFIKIDKKALLQNYFHHKQNSYTNQNTAAFKLVNINPKILPRIKLVVFGRLIHSTQTEIHIFKLNISSMCIVSCEYAFFACILSLDLTF